MYKRQNLFIQSPGGLRGISLAQLESVEHAQAAVNQRLYQIAKRLRTNDGASVIEGEGGGIREVFAATAARNLPRPQLIDTGVQFKALLWRPSEAAVVVTPPVVRHQGDHEFPTETTACPMRSTSPRNTSSIPHTSNPTRNEERVLAALVTGREMTIHELTERTGLTIGQVRYALDLPLKEGVVVMAGRQGVKSTHYRIQTVN